MMEKEVRKSVVTLNSNLLYFWLKKGLNPAQICMFKNIPKSTLQYHLNKLQKANFIKKISYGVWEIIKPFNQKEVRTSLVIGRNTRGGFRTSLKPDTVRAHGFMFKLKIPKLRNWERREEYFLKQKIGFKPYLVGGVKRGQQIKHKDKTIQITDRSIIIQTKESYLSETAQGSKSHAIYDLIKIIKWLENSLKASFQIDTSYFFKVSRHHYSLIKNALAKQYNQEGKKLNVYCSNGLWFVIDNSFNLHEAETVNRLSADTDNLKIQNFFNGIKKYEDFTPEFLVNSIGQVTANQTLFAKNMKTHIKAIQDLGKGVNKLTNLVQELKK